MNIAGDRKALVTGAASGIGFEVARTLAREGARVAMLDVNRELLDASAAEIGDAACAIGVDVRSAADVRGAVARATDELGGLDTVVICAGVIHVKPLGDVTEEDWDHTLDIN